jgi:branched-chain amino acid transport system substrate-binding protein
VTTRKFATAFAVGLGFYGILLTAAFAQTLKIGVIAPLTGPGAPWGLAMATGAKILAEQYNAEGGLDVGGKKYQIQIVAYDDEYKTPQAVAVYRRLVDQDDVKYIVIAAGASTMAVKQNIEDDKVIGMTSGYVAGEIGPDTKYMYRMWGVPADYYPALYDWLRNNTPARRVAILNPNDETARDMSALSESLLKKGGYEIVSNEVYERSVRDFLPLLTKILAQKPEIIDLGATAPATTAVLIRQAREFGYKGLFFIPGSTSWKEIVDSAGVEGSEGVITVLYVDPANEAYKRFAAEFKKTIGQDPNEVLAPYTDGVNVLIHSIQKSGAVNDTSKFDAGFQRALPMDSLQGEKMTIGGKEHYGVDHQVNAVRYVGIIKDGKPTIVGKIQ